MIETDIGCLTKPSVKKSSLVDRFPVGAKVVPSESAIDAGRFATMRKRGQEVVGEVVGYSVEGDCIRVHLAGRKRSMLWHPAFWKVS